MSRIPEGRAAHRRLARRLLVASAAGLMIVLSACSSPRSPDTIDTSRGSGLPSSHVHAVAVNPSDDGVLLATHDGLFELKDGGGEPRRIGPVIDLMGFTVVGPDHFYASGHPGRGTDLPNPVGLIESVDGGQTWTSVSRAGESDFHALTATPSGVIAYGGRLEYSRDGTDWKPLITPAGVFDVAAAPDGATVVVTTEQGPRRSTDAGTSWQLLEGAPLLVFIEWTGPAELLAVTPDGQVHISQDAGTTWQSRGTVPGQPQALGVVRGDGIRVLVVTGDTVYQSFDTGATFAALPAGG